MSNSLAPVYDESSLEVQDPPSGTLRKVDRSPIEALDPSPRLPSSVSSSELQQHLHLVRAAVARFIRRLPPNVLREDLVAAGTIGLMDAIMKYTGEPGLQFEWYARVRIRGAILDELRRQDWLSRRTRSRQPRPGRESVAPRVVAVDDLHDQAHVAELCDEDLAERHAERVALSDAVRQLPARERSIVELHYLRGVQFKEIAELFSVSVPRISQLHARAIEMLRGLLEACEGGPEPTVA